MLLFLHRFGKVPLNVPTVPIDGISFHPEDCVHKWKIVVKQRIADEVVIFDQHCSYKAIFDLITAASLLPTITDVDPFYLKFIREFIVNLPADLNDHGSILNTKRYMFGVSALKFIMLFSISSWSIPYLLIILYVYHFLSNLHWNSLVVQFVNGRLMDRFL